MTMTTASQLALIKSQTLAIMANLTASPKPNYTIDGQSVSWGDYMKQLMDTMKWVDDQIAANEGPFELETHGYPT